jgi:rhomboid protease GluP
MKEKVTVKKINFTIVIFTISLIVFILDFFILLQHNTVVFSINHLIQGNDWGILTEYGRLNGTDIFAGQWWRLITSIFLHAGIPHLIVNMIALLIVGFIVEEKIGSKRYVITFMGSGIISALFTMTHTNGAVGTSGAIYGIIGAMMVIFAKESSYIVYKMSLIKWILLILYLILPNLSGIVTIIAHISGLFSGIIITLFMYSFFKMTVTHINKKDHYSQ